MCRVLVVYASRHGSTREVAETVTETLRHCDFQTDIRAVKEATSLGNYSAVVFGAPLYMYRLHKDARRFLSQNREVLTRLPVALFVLGPTHDPRDEQEWQDSRNQLNKELTKFPWLTPMAIEVFGGKYDPAVLGFPIKLFIGNEPASDIRDWTAIRQWATDLSRTLKSALP